MRIWIPENLKKILVLVKVFTEDCSNLLDQILAETKGPRKGEVEMLVAGPPCQGFSQLNHHPGSQASLLKNSVVSPRKSETSKGGSQEI
jgi:site-specific DNA-cytosine methylase